MDIDKLERTYHHLLNYIKANYKGQHFCTMTETMVKDIIAHKGEFSSYAEYYAKFIDSDGIFAVNKKNKLIEKSRTLRRIWAFEEYDHMPDKLRFQPVVVRVEKYELLSDEFKCIVDVYRELIDKQELTNGYKVSQKALLVNFLSYVVENGVTSINDITPILLSGYFYADEKCIRGNSVSQNLKNIFYNICDKFPRLNELTKFIPKQKDVEHIHGIIPEEKVQEAIKIIFNEESKYSLRDRAIIAIGIFTGLRGSDIASLTLDNIDWANDCIKIIQSKTQAPLTLPLMPSIGNIIFDYITKERPKDIVDRKLFYNKVNPSKPFIGRNARAVVTRFFADLGIDGTERNRGLQALRHRLASALMHNGTEVGVIRSILGHTAPESLNHYVDMDIEDLRLCGLDVSMYPISEEVYR